MDRATLRLIDRGDLLVALDRAAAGKVTIISAPAGSGKTSLLRAWAGRPGQAHRLAVVQVQREHLGSGPAMPPKWRNAVLSARQGLSQHEPLIRQATADVMHAGTLDPLRHPLPVMASWVLASLPGPLHRFHRELRPMR